jgi:hypothetical protein
MLHATAMLHVAHCTGTRRSSGGTGRSHASKQRQHSSTPRPSKPTTAAQLPAVVGLLCIASLRMPRMLQRESAAASAAKCMGVIARIFADMSCPWRLNSGWRDRRISWLRRNGARVEQLQSLFILSLSAVPCSDLVPRYAPCVYCFVPLTRDSAEPKPADDAPCSQSKRCRTTSLRPKLGWRMRTSIACSIRCSILFATSPQFSIELERVTANGVVLTIAAASWTAATKTRLCAQSSCWQRQQRPETSAAPWH